MAIPKKTKIIGCKQKNMAVNKEPKGLSANLQPILPKMIKGIKNGSKKGVRAGLLTTPQNQFTMSGLSQPKIARNRKNVVRIKYAPPRKAPILYFHRNLRIDIFKSLI
jgi:hypothetical protein